MKFLWLLLILMSGTVQAKREAFCFYTAEAGFASGRMLSSQASLEADKRQEKIDHAFDHLRNCMHIDASAPVLEKVRQTYERLMKEAGIPGKEISPKKPVLVYLRGAEAAPNVKLLTLPKNKMVKFSDDKNNEILLKTRLVHHGIVEFEFSLNSGKRLLLHRGLGPRETISLDLLLKEWGVQDTMFVRIEKINGKKTTSHLRFISAQ